MSQIKILVNEKEYIFDDKVSLRDILERLNISKEGIAICVNGDIVRKARFGEYMIKDGDKVDIITMVGGG